MANSEFPEAMNVMSVRPLTRWRWARLLAICLVWLILIYGVLVASGFLQRRFLTQPFGYGADAPAVYGWNGVEYVYNNYKARIGAPLTLAGRPAMDRAGCVLFEPDCTMIWIIGRVTGSIVSGVNIYFYLTYALCFLFALFGMRFFGASWPASAVMAALFALLPYHQMRNINHLHEDSYFIVPAYAVILYLIYRAGQAPVLATAQSAQPWRDRLIAHRWALPIALLFVFFPASLQKYHQFFFALFAFFAGVLGSVDSRKPRPVLIGALFAMVACAGLLARGAFDNAAWGDPNHLLHTANQVTTYGEDERYPLKLVQMLLPIPGHRIHLLAAMRAGYDSGHPMVSYETSTVSLGLIGALGLVGLIWVFLTFGPKAKPSPRFIARLALFGILLGVMGGLGGILADLSWAIAGPRFPLSQARGWDRVVIFVAFFALLTSAWGFDRLIAFATKRISLHSGTGRALAWMFALTIFAIGVFDQVKSAPHQIYKNDDAIYLSDKAFFASIDGMNRGSYQVFQWPVMFPWGGSYNGIYYTDAYRPLLNSRHMELSFGADPDSKQGKWLTALSEKAPETIFNQLCALGFEGVLVHDAAVAATQHSFVELLDQKARAIQSGRGLSYYDLRRACGVPPSAANECIARLRSDLLETEDRKKWIGGEQFAGEIGTFIPGNCGGSRRRSELGQSGWLTIGPYVPLRPGAYTATFEFSGKTKPSRLMVDWHDGTDAHTLVEVRPPSAAGSFSVPFAITGPVGRLVEFRVGVDGAEPVVFRGVELNTARSH